MDYGTQASATPHSAHHGSRIIAIPERWLVGDKHAPRGTQIETPRDLIFIGVGACDGSNRG